MAGFSELIKSFEKTRDYIRDFFIYGFKGRGDFQRRSSRTYDDEKRRAESWLGEVLRCDDSVRGRQISISVDCGHIYENPLCQAYSARSFTDNDIRLHMLLLDLLADGSTKTLNEIVDGLLEQYDASFEPQTVRGKLKEYTDEGLLITEKRGKTAYYRRSPDTAQQFFAQFDGLADAVRFFSLDDTFGEIGTELLRSADLKNDLFLRKHHYIVHTLEDILLPEILTAVTEQRAVHLRTFSAKSRANPDAKGGSFEAVPMQILSSVQTGRRYLAAYLPAEKRFHAFRLDFIRSVKRSEPAPDYDDLAESYQRNLRRVFGVSFAERRDVGNVEPMRLTFRYDPQTEDFILGRLMREKRIGTLTYTGSGLCTLTVDAFDPNEVMHWAKTLIGRIVSVEGGNDAVREKFRRDIRRMHKMYGGAPHDDLS